MGLDYHRIYNELSAACSKVSLDRFVCFRSMVEGAGGVAGLGVKLEMSQFVSRT